MDILSEMKRHQSALDMMKQLERSSIASQLSRQLPSQVGSLDWIQRRLGSSGITRRLLEEAAAANDWRKRFLDESQYSALFQIKRETDALVAAQRAAFGSFGGRAELAGLIKQMQSASGASYLESLQASAMDLLRMRDQLVSGTPSAYREYLSSEIDQASDLLQRANWQKLAEELDADEDVDDDNLFLKVRDFAEAQARRIQPLNALPDRDLSILSIRLTLWFAIIAVLQALLFARWDADEKEESDHQRARHAQAAARAQQRAIAELHRFIVKSMKKLDPPRWGVGTRIAIVFARPEFRRGNRRNALPPGHVVVEMGEDRQWLYVRYMRKGDERFGWVLKKYVVRLEPVEVPADDHMPVVPAPKKMAELEQQRKP